MYRSSLTRQTLFDANPVIPSASRGIPWRKLKGNAAGSLGPSRTGGYARDDELTDRAVS